MAGATCADEHAELFKNTIVPVSLFLFQFNQKKERKY